MNTVFVIYNIVAGAILVASITMLVEMLKGKRNVKQIREHYETVNKKLALEIQRYKKLSLDDKRIIGQQNVFIESKERKERALMTEITNLKNEIVEWEKSSDSLLKEMDACKEELAGIRDRVVLVSRTVDPKLRPSKKIEKLAGPISPYCYFNGESVSIVVLKPINQE